jgi:hypothetical protein
MKALNVFELAILQAIANENNDKCSWLIKHLDIVGVKKREYTGVGLYTTFEYPKLVKENDHVHSSFSSEKLLNLPGVNII